MFRFERLKEQPLEIWNIGLEMGTRPRLVPRFGVALCGPEIRRRYHDVGLLWAHVEGNGLVDLMACLRDGLDEEEEEALLDEVLPLFGSSSYGWNPVKTPASFAYWAEDLSNRRAKTLRDILENRGRVRPKNRNLIRTGEFTIECSESKPIEKWLVKIPAGCGQDLARHFAKGFGYNCNDESGYVVGVIWIDRGLGGPEFVSAFHQHLGETDRSLLITTAAELSGIKVSGSVPTRIEGGWILVQRLHES